MSGSGLPSSDTGAEPWTNEPYLTTKTVRAPSLGRSFRMFASDTATQPAVGRPSVPVR